MHRCVGYWVEIAGSTILMNSWNFQFIFYLLNNHFISRLRNLSAQAVVEMGVRTWVWERCKDWRKIQITINFSLIKFQRSFVHTNKRVLILKEKNLPLRNTHCSCEYSIPTPNLLSPALSLVSRSRCLLSPPFKCFWEKRRRVWKIKNIHHNNNMPTSHMRYSLVGWRGGSTNPVFFMKICKLWIHLYRSYLTQNDKMLWYYYYCC